MPAVNNKKNVSNLKKETRFNSNVNSNDREVSRSQNNADIEEALFGEELPSRSIVSRAIFSYDVPEVENLQASFVYNFFTRDERVRKTINPDEQLINLNASNTSDIHYQLKNDKIPRYVKFSFKPARDPYAKIAKNVTTIIRDNLDKIVIEGAGSTVYHTGVELLDTNLEKSIYTKLSGSFTFIDAVTDKDSPKSAAEKLEKEIAETGGLFGESKKLIIEAMGNMQPEGASFAPSDVPPEIAQTANDPLSKQTFSLKFNNLFIGDITRAATRIPDKVFQDEIEGLKRVAQEIQTNVTDTIDPKKVSDAEFEKGVEAISVRPFNITKDQSILSSNHEITQLGYIIQRTEILPDETAVALETLYADNPQSLYVIDKNVRYGGVYVYKVRTVCKVKSLVRDTDKSFALYDQLSIAEFLLASEGVTTSVNCVEHEPPPPPVRVRARLEPHLKKPVLNWQFPLNQQRDIKRFQIFKRLSIKEPFKLVCEYDFDDSMVRTEPVEIADQDRLFSFDSPRLDYLDNDFKPGESPIYAISCVDAHGYSSNYSAQIKVTYQKHKNRIVTKVISGEGAPKPYPNLLLESDAFSDVIKSSGYERMTVFFDPEYYRVLKTLKTNFGSKKNAKNPRSMSLKGLLSLEIDQNFLAINPEKPTYQIQILNVDLQKDQLVDIKIADKTGAPGVVEVSKISKNNLNFEFGVE